MAYCKKCGAYIPDGQTDCLACGYDEAAEQRKEAKFSGGFAAEYEKEKNDTERRRTEREKKQQEREKRRIEYERRRREQQEENRQWAEEEHRKRQEQSTPSYSAVYKGAEPLQHKALAIMSYFSILFVLPLLFCPQDKFACYHAKQGMALAIFGVVADFIASLFPVGWLLNLFRVYCIFKGIGNANSGKTEPLPYIGKIFDK